MWSNWNLTPSNHIITEGFPKVMEHVSEEPAAVCLRLREPSEDHRAEHSAVQPSPAAGEQGAGRRAWGPKVLTVKRGRDGFRTDPAFPCWPGDVQLGPTLGRTIKSSRPSRSRP